MHPTVINSGKQNLTARADPSNLPRSISGMAAGWEATPSFTRFNFRLQPQTHQVT